METELDVQREGEKVSVIIPTFDSERFIAEALESVCAQSYSNWEAIVIDDCSSDKTAQIVAKLGKRDSRIRLVRAHENGGAAVARNLGIRKASGDYIAFLDSDDTWEPTKLERQIAFMRKKGASFSFTAYKIVNELGVFSERVVDVDTPMIVNYRDMLMKRATLGCSTVILDRRKIPTIEMPLIRTGQDYGLWLKILKSGEEAFCLKETLTSYRIVKGSISSNKFKKARRQWEIYRQLEGLGIFDSLYYFANYANRAIFRK